MCTSELAGNQSPIGLTPREELDRNAVERFKTERPNSPLFLGFFGKQVVQFLFKPLDGQADHV